MSAQDRLAATLAEHRLESTNRGCWICRCGTRTLGPEGHEAHVAAVIAGTDDLAVIEVPKPDDDAEYGKVWRDDDVLGTVQVLPDGSIMSHSEFEYGITLAEMRVAAGVAAAAAKAAEAAEAVSDR